MRTAARAAAGTEIGWVHSAMSVADGLRHCWCVRWLSGVIHSLSVSSSNHQQSCCCCCSCQAGRMGPKVAFLMPAAASPDILLMPVSSLQTVVTCWKGSQISGLFLLTLAAPGPLGLPSGPAPLALHALATEQAAMKCMPLQRLPMSAAALDCGYTNVLHSGAVGAVTQGLWPAAGAVDPVFMAACCWAVTASTACTSRTGTSNFNTQLMSKLRNDCFLAAPARETGPLASLLNDYRLERARDQPSL